MDVQGLLLCAVCENQLSICEYKGGHGFFIVEPCKHCATQEADSVVQLESSGVLDEHQHQWR